MRKQTNTRSKSKVTVAIYACLSLCAFAFVFSVFSVINTNDLRFEKISKISYINDLKDQNEKLEVSVTKLKTAQNLKELAIGMNMVENSGVEYVSVGGSSNVALNNR